MLPAVRRPAPAFAADLISEQLLDTATDSVVVWLDAANPAALIRELDETPIRYRANEFCIHD